MSATVATLATCLMLAAQTYQVPPAVLVGIMHVEGGRIGQEVRNTNGTYDLGPMQINTIWLPELADSWNVDKRTAKAWVRDNGCVNVHVSAWILRQQYDRTGSIRGAIASYHSRTPSLGRKYATKVIAAMDRNGLIDYSNVQRFAARSVSE